MWIKHLCNHRIWDFAITFQVRKLFGTIQKRAPAKVRESGHIEHLLDQNHGKSSWQNNLLDNSDKGGLDSIWTIDKGQACINVTECKQANSVRTNTLGAGGVRARGGGRTANWELRMRVCSLLCYDLLMSWLSHEERAVSAIDRREIKTKAITRSGTSQGHRQTSEPTEIWSKYLLLTWRTEKRDLVGAYYLAKKIRKFRLKVKWNSNYPENPLRNCRLPPGVSSCSERNGGNFVTILLNFPVFSLSASAENNYGKSNCKW